MATSVVAPQAKDLWTSVNYCNGSLEDEELSKGSQPKRSFHERKLAFYSNLEGKYDPRQVHVRDMRGQEGRFGIDTHGFQLCELRSKNEDWKDDEAIKTIYYPEVEDLLKKVTGASEIIIYDHMIRNQTFEASMSAPPDDNTVDIPGPATMVHIDDTPWQVRRLIRELRPADEAAALLARSFVEINTWRPLKKIVRDPLGIIDANTIRKEDRVERVIPSGDSMGEDYVHYQVKHGKQAEQRHEWWYPRGQEPHEALLFKIYDSRDEDGFLGAGHCSFRDQEAEVDENGHEVPARESIEVRALCFF